MCGELHSHAVTQTGPCPATVTPCACAYGCEIALQVGPTPQETSELQVKLLSGLLPKLWLKLGLLALRHAAALARLRERLLQHIELTEAGKLCIRVVRGWRGAAIPSAGMVAAADDFHRGLQRRQKQLLLQSWQAWARHRRYEP